MSLNKDLQQLLLDHTSVRPIDTVSAFRNAGIALGYLRADVTTWSDAIAAMAIDLAVLDIGQGLGNLFSKLEKMAPVMSSRVLKSIFRAFDLEPDQVNANKILRLEATNSHILELRDLATDARALNSVLANGSNEAKVLKLGIDMVVAAKDASVRLRDRLMAELAGS